MEILGVGQMFDDFLPVSVLDIQDAEAIALLQQIQRRVVQVPFPGHNGDRHSSCPLPP